MRHWIIWNGPNESMSPYKWNSWQRQCQRHDMKKKILLANKWFLRWKGGHKLRNAGILEARKGKEMDSVLTKEHSPAYLAFSPVKCILDFCLSVYVIIICVVLSHQILTICYSSKKLIKCTSQGLLYSVLFVIAFIILLLSAYLFIWFFY